MAIEINCPSCQTRMRVADTAAGKKARCPQCQAICEIPAASASEPAPLPQQADSPLADIPLTPLTPLSSAAPSSPFGPLGNSGPASKPEPDLKPNPFGDSIPLGGGGQTAPNPYASPNFDGGSMNLPLTTDEVRMRLLGPAIGIVIGSLFCLGYVALSVLGSFFVQRPPQMNDAEQIGYYVGLIGVQVVMAVPSLCMLAGSIALFTAKRPWLAWVGVIAAVLPCNPCCFISIGFGIWGIVMLCDPRVSQAMQ